VIADAALDQDRVEYKARRDSQPRLMPFGELLDLLGKGPPA